MALTIGAAWATTQPSAQIDLYGSASTANRNALLSIGNESNLSGVAIRNESSRQAPIPETLNRAFDLVDKKEEARLASFGFSVLEDHLAVVKKSLRAAHDKGVFIQPSQLSVHWRTDASDTGPEAISNSGKEPFIRYTVELTGKSVFDFVSKKYGPDLVAFHEQGHCEHSASDFSPTSSLALPYSMTEKQAKTLAVIGKMGGGKAAELLRESYADAFTVAGLLATYGDSDPAGVDRALTRFAGYRDMILRIAPEDVHGTGHSIKEVLKLSGTNPNDSAELRRTVSMAGLKGALLSVQSQSEVSGKLSKEDHQIRHDSKANLIGEATPTDVAYILSDWIAKKTVLSVKGKSLSREEVSTLSNIPNWDRATLGDPEPHLRRALLDLKTIKHDNSYGSIYSLTYDRTVKSLEPFIAANFEGGLDRLDWKQIAVDAHKNITYATDQTAFDVEHDQREQQKAKNLPFVAPPSASELSDWRAKRTVQSANTSSPTQESFKTF